MPIYNYKCPDGHITEFFARLDDRDKPQKCRCGKQAKKMISCPKIRTPIDSDKWAEMHEKGGRTEESENLVHY